MITENKARLEFNFVFAERIAELGNIIYARCREMIDFVAEQVPESKDQTDLFARISDWQAVAQAEIDEAIREFDRAVEERLKLLRAQQAVDENDELARLESTRHIFQSVINRLDEYETGRMQTLKQFIDVNYHDQEFGEVLNALMIDQFRQQRKIVLGMVTEHLWTFPKEMLKKKLDNGELFSLAESQSWLDEVRELYTSFAEPDNPRHLRWFAAEEFDFASTS